MKVELRASQPQKSGMFLGPLCAKGLLVTFLAAGHVAGLDVRVLDAAYQAGGCSGKGITFSGHTSYFLLRHFTLFEPMGS